VVRGCAGTPGKPLHLPGCARLRFG
jgi:hypothetical protein